MSAAEPLPEPFPRAQPGSPGAVSPQDDHRVSRRRYERERCAREDAEKLLETKSRALFEANERLQRQAEMLEAAVRARTADLERARAAAEAANEAKSIFLATMSHEIRTPMNGVLGMAAALADTPLCDQQRQMLDVIVDSGNVLMAVLNDILDFSKIEAGRLELEEASFCMTDIVAPMQRIYALRAEEKGLRFEVSVSRQARRKFRGDPVRIRQVLDNLLSNAMKFTAKGSVSLSVDHCCSGEGKATLCFSVADTGPGIDPERVARLFRPFSQGDVSTTRRHGGTGLGLVISRRLCEMMGGNLEVESEPGCGSVFRCRIKADFADIQAAPRAAPGAPAMPPPDVALPAAPPRRRLRVLAAEDNRTNQLVLRHMLARLDVDLILSGNGREAVRAWSEGRFDLVLMDIQMPEMDGLEATMEIRRRERAESRARTPIVALSANAMKHQVEEYLAHGLDRHVPKPVRREDLARLLEEIRRAGPIPEVRATASG